MCSGSQPIHTSIGVVPHYCRDCTQCQLVLQRSRQIERNRYYSIPQSRICHRRLSTIQQTFDRWKWVTNSSLSTTSFYDPSDSPPLSPPNEFDSPRPRRLVVPPQPRKRFNLAFEQSLLNQSNRVFTFLDYRSMKP